MKDAQVNDLVFAVGLYAAVSRGTIGMMRQLAYQKNQDYDEVLKQEEAQRILDSINGVQDTVAVVQNQYWFLILNLATWIWSVELDWV